MSTNGFLQWTKSVTGQAVYMPQCLAIDSNGAIYIGGRFRGTAEFTKGAISSLANLPNESGLLASDGFVSKLDSQGNWLWTVALPSNTYCVANCVAVGPDHNISLSASFQGIVNIGSSSFESAGSFDILLFQLDSKTGSVNWANRVGGSSGSDLCGGIAFDDDGNINVIGTFADRVVFGNQTLSADGKSTNCFWSKLTSGGNFLDSRRIVSAANILSSGIHFDAVGNGYFVGSAFGSSPVRLPQRQVQSRLGGGYAFKLPITRENVLSNPTRKPSAQ